MSFVSCLFKVSDKSLITFGELDVVLCLALRYFFPPPSCERNILIGQIYLAHLISLHSSSYLELILPQTSIGKSK